MSSAPDMRASAAARGRRQIDEIQRLARAVRAEAAYLRSLSLDIGRHRRAAAPIVRRIDQGRP